MEILINNPQMLSEIDWEDLQNKAKRILEELGFSERSILSIALVDRDEMRRLNAKYRDKDCPTNVLSFSQKEGEAFTAADSNLLGDVVICIDVARQQAAELGYTLQEMATYLLIHGIVHLSGQHHDDPAHAHVMAQRVNELFDAVFPSQ
uniref:Endoribonuclease YbeY n=1 Tax=Desulfomonile tiedjei TaxID=2358 RepID=A0A7C4EVE7_9BACT